MTSGIKTYSHTQNTDSATWTVVHSLGRKPVFDILLDNNGVLEKALPLYVTYPDNNTVVFTFSTASSGKVRLS